MVQEWAVRSNFSNCSIQGGDGFKITRYEAGIRREWDTSPSQGTMHILIHTQGKFRVAA